MSNRLAICVESRYIATNLERKKEKKQEKPETVATYESKFTKEIPAFTREKNSSKHT